MPTYQQLNAEQAWRDEYVPEPMKWFCREIAAALGVPAGNVGAKGDNLHLNGGHRSQRWILTSAHCTNRTYTVSPGLPGRLLDALGAVDITPRSREQMLRICRNLDRGARGGLIEEVVAWYGNTNNDQRVDGWDNIRNRVASSDPSHLWHLHLTFDRWHVDNRAMFERLLAILTGQPEEDTMAEPTVSDWRQEAMLAGRLTVAGGATKGEPNLLREQLDRIEDKVADRVTLTADDRAAVVADLKAGLGDLIERSLRNVLGGLDGATPPGDG